MKSLCLFASYVAEIGLPYHSSIYLTELKKHYTDIVYIHTNQLDENAIRFFKELNITSKSVVNEGFDFGQWQKVLATIQMDEYDQLCLVNDSCVLFASLDNLIKWFNVSDIDFGGLTENSYNKKHIQSYFLLFKKSVLNDVVSFFKNNKTSHDIYKIIADFEIGLSQYLISKNYSCGAFLSNDGYVGEFAPYYQCLESHIKQGSPMIKKKILFYSYRKPELFTLARMNFNINADYYISLIKQITKEPLIDFDRVKLDQSSGMSALDKFVYNIKRVSILNYRKFKGKHHD
jgi:lipopolysaccharide biosynthesis protein